MFPGRQRRGDDRHGFGSRIFGEAHPMSNEQCQQLLTIGNIALLFLGVIVGLLAGILAALLTK